MQAVQYLSPRSLDEALAFMQQYAGCIKPYAGGTDLMVQLRERASKLADTQWLMDLQYLPELRGITEQDTTITIGAIESHTRVSEDPVIRRYAGMLASAASQVGSPQVRNRGTIGGNVANASPAADTISPLAAMNAVATVASVRGVRQATLQELYTPRGKSALEADEIILNFRIEKLEGWHTAFIKLGRRKALAISRLNTSVALRLEDGVIADARIAPGCVFSAPDRVKTAEALLIGKQPDRALFAEAAQEVAQEMIRRTGVRWSTAYKEPALIAVVQQTLEKAWESAT